MPVAGWRCEEMGERWMNCCFAAACMVGCCKACELNKHL